MRPRSLSARDPSSRKRPQDILGNVPDSRPYVPAITGVCAGLYESVGFERRETNVLSLHASGDALTVADEFRLDGRLLPGSTGLVTLWRGSGGRPSVSLGRSVFERRAPSSSTNSS